MADSVRVRIAKAVEARLNLAEVTTPDGATFPRPEGLHVFRGRLSPLRLPVEPDPEFPDDPGDPGEVPATVVTLMPEEAERGPGSPHTGRMAARELVLALEHIAVGEPAEDVIDPLYVWGTAALMSDTTLGGLVNSIEEIGSEPFADEEHVAVGGLGVGYRIRYHTLFCNPEVRS